MCHLKIMEQLIRKLKIIKSVKVLASQLASKLPTRKTRFRVRSLAAQSPSNTLELPIIFLAVGLDCILCSIFCFATALYAILFCTLGANDASETRWGKFTINVSINCNDFFTN